MYVPEVNWVFCHIPRTGGTSLSEMIRRAFPSAVDFTQDVICHQSSNQIREKFPQARIFSIIRNPWKIWESNYGWIRRYRVRLDLPNETWDEYLNSHTVYGWPCKSPGFYQTFVDDKTWVFKYEDNPLPLIEELLGKSLQNVFWNETIHEPPAWTQQQIELIRNHCRDDIERFGYTPHPDMVRA